MVQISDRLGACRPPCHPAAPACPHTGRAAGLYSGEAHCQGQGVRNSAAESRATIARLGLPFIHGEFILRNCRARLLTGGRGRQPPLPRLRPVAPRRRRLPAAHCRRRTCSVALDAAVGFIMDRVDSQRRRRGRRRAASSTRSVLPDRGRRQHNKPLYARSWSCWFLRLYLLRQPRATCRTRRCAPAGAGLDPTSWTLSTRPSTTRRPRTSPLFHGPGCSRARSATINAVRLTPRPRRGVCSERLVVDEAVQHVHGRQRAPAGPWPAPCTVM